MAVCLARPAVRDPARRAFEHDELRPGDAPALGRAKLERRALADLGGADGDELDGAIAVGVAVALLVRAVEALLQVGPELVVLDGATCWVPRGWAGETDAQGTLVLERTR